LKLVARGPGPLRSGFGRARGLRDGIARPLQLRGDPATLPLALGALARERGRRGRELFVAGEERALLVAQPDLVALAEQMRALGLDARGTCLRERDARARRLLLGDTGGVGELARASRPRGGFRVDTASAFAQGRELPGEGRERRAGAARHGSSRTPSTSPPARAAPPRAGRSRGGCRSRGRAPFPRASSAEALPLVAAATAGSRRPPR